MTKGMMDRSITVGSRTPWLIRIGLTLLVIAAVVALPLVFMAGKWLSTF